MRVCMKFKNKRHVWGKSSDSKIESKPLIMNTFSKYWLQSTDFDKFHCLNHFFLLLLCKVDTDAKPLKWTYFAKINLYHVETVEIQKIDTYTKISDWLMSKLRFTCIFFCHHRCVSPFFGLHSYIPLSFTTSL